ncbi:phage tail tip lysozyme [Dyella lutea]|uniref:Phage tail tip lysozyme n=1 Tax=Dyella lutea TaxID=2950441 RepID=A0ABT1FHZ6_9GAMM|nr:phage tail tip lysozyme [Dyella lutea]MCP1376048.1 phage tail tip lysozyme [Dyella lutea]
MSNVFTITISAVDKATATVRKVNDAMGRITRPFEQAGKSFKGLGRELGFEKIGKNLASIGQSAGRAARGIGSIVAPMAAVTGVASVGGVIALADGWAKLGRNVTYSAQNIGIGTDRLQAFQGMAKLAGISSDTMTQSLQTLGDTMEDALYGRNQQALMLFNRLGVGIKRTSDGALDAAGEFRALASAIYNIKSPQQQNLVAGQFGLTGLLPLIRQGPAAMDKLMARARALGLVMDGPALKAANNFAMSIEGLKASGEGLRNAIGNAIIPAIKPLVDQLTGWISKNRELISAKVGEWARDFGKWLKSIDWQKVGAGITGFIKGVGDLVDWLGGWKKAAIGVGIVMGAGFISNVVSLGANVVLLGVRIGGLITKMWGLKAAADAASAASAGGMASSLGMLGKAGLYGAAAAGGIYLGSKISDAMDGTTFGDKFSHYNTKYLGAALSLIGFKNNQFSRAARYDGYDQKYSGAGSAAGIDAGLSARVVSYFEKQGWSLAQAKGIAANLMSESALNPNARGDNGRAYGLAQWHADRQGAFAKWAGKPLQGSSLQDQLGFVQYELTKGSEQRAGALLRGAQTADMAGRIVSNYYERPASPAEAARRGALAQQLAAPAGPYSSGSGQSGKVHVEVELKNAPPGTKATAKSSGAAEVSLPRIGYSQVGDW